MSGLFSGIETASRALRAFQLGLDTTGHNIANVNTQGYSRQTVDFVATSPNDFWSQGLKSVGTGVQVSSINRIRDLFLQGKMHSATSDQNLYGSLSTSMKDILATLNEPGDTGVSAAIGKFYDSWSALASNPNESANRQATQQAGQTLADRVRNAWKQLDNTQSDTNTQASQTIDQINKIGQSIAALNDSIRQQTATGGTPNDLLDQRDQLVQDLSSLVNVTSKVQSDGSVTVFAGEFNLVDVSGARTLPNTFDTATSTITGLTVPIHITSGKLGGFFQSSQKYAAAKTSLDTLANALRTQINGIHATGTNANGTTGINFFNDVAAGQPQTGAQDFDLSAQVAADFKNIATTSLVDANGKALAGDGSLALSISKARATTVGGLNNLSTGDYWTSQVSDIGTQQARFEQSGSTQDSIIQQTTQQQQAVSGVNLDDEMSNMLRFQRSYQAAAKLLSIFDQVTDDTLNMIKR